MRSTLAGLALAMTAFATGARSQVIDDPQANVVEALVVTPSCPARPGGGSLTPTPRSMSWGLPTPCPRA
jgi:hypothetical protein